MYTARFSLRTNPSRRKTLLFPKPGARFVRFKLVVPVRSCVGHSYLRLWVQLRGRPRLCRVERSLPAARHGSQAQAAGGMGVLQCEKEL